MGGFVVAGGVAQRLPRKGHRAAAKADKGGNTRHKRMWDSVCVCGVFECIYVCVCVGVYISVCVCLHGTRQMQIPG